MVSLQPGLDSLLKSLLPGPVDQQKLDGLVRKALTEKNKFCAENRKSQWEYLLKNDIFILAATEGKALKDEGTTYYDQLRTKLDLILTFTEHEACEQTFPFIVLQDLLETQTIASCSHIFSWIEGRATRLTEGMVPQKGKALILLRTLNDLLRRLSKMGSTTIFCGRILTFLSGVFPLGERSGVNLRGEYGPTWEGVKEPEKGQNEGSSEEAITEVPIEPKETEGEGDKMQVDEVKKSISATKPSERKDEFYNTFWSLQLPFSKPPIFTLPNTFSEFREAVNKVLPVIKEATAKERAMMGSRSGVGGTGSLKRKREPDTAEETSTNEYFFAKFLTSPDLLDLEIADTHFRRQFLFQLLILLNHLLTFTKAAKATWSSSRNRSLQMDFTLETADAQWVQEMLTKAMEELRQTTPNGRAFGETVNVILEREKNWVKWKNELCAPFDKEPWAVDMGEKKIGLEEATAEVRRKMREEPKDWEWRLGSEPLTEIWDMGYRDLDDLRNPFQPGDVKDFVKKVKQEDMRIEMRSKALAKVAERLANVQAKTTAPKPVPPTAPMGVLSSLGKESAGPSSKSQETPAPSSDASLSPSTSRSLANSTLSNPASSPLHPSLPAKPGSSSPTKPISSSQESGRSSTPVPLPPAPAPPPVLAQAPVQVITPAPIASTSTPTDDQIIKFEDNKQRWSWLALRTARDQHLQHFGKIGTGDINLLAIEIEKEKQDREKLQKGEEMSGASVMGPTEEHGTGSPIITACAAPPGGVDDGKIVDVQNTDAEGDIKMDER